MPHIFLYGPPGSGKTTLGSQLAASLQMPFVDLDQAIQARTGVSVPQLVEECGETGFRDVEASVLEEQVARQDTIIALGGGTLLRLENRRMAESLGRVVCLRAKQSVLLHRLAADADSRPLLAGNLEQKLDALLDARAEHYASFTVQFDSDQPTQMLTGQLQAVLGRFHLSAMGDYDVVIENRGIRQLGEALRVRGVKHPIVVTDENVYELYSEEVLKSLRRSGYQAHTLIIPAGESSKTLVTVERLWDGFLEAGLDRGSTVIALGGGVVGDLAGFAASTFMRGIGWICVPTTLLAMIDASLGGKTGFDLPHGKNLIGAFHAPRLVLIDPEVLSSLPESESRSGLAEVVKHGIIGDTELFDLCAHGFTRVQEHLSEIIRRAVAVKVKMIEADPYEEGARVALNLGHTVGHAVEVVSEFGIRHGEAVAIGMVAESRMAERLAIARPGLSDWIASTLSSLGLPVRVPPELPRGELIRVMQNDKKKAAGVVRFSLPADIGRVIVNVEVRELQSVLEEGAK